MITKEYVVKGKDLNNVLRKLERFKSMLDKLKKEKYKLEVFNTGNEWIGKAFVDYEKRFKNKIFKNNTRSF